MPTDKEHITTYVRPETYKKLDALRKSKTEQRTMSNMCEILLEEALAARGRKGGKS